MPFNCFTKQEAGKIFIELVFGKDLEIRSIPGMHTVHIHMYVHICDICIHACTHILMHT